MEPRTTPDGPKTAQNNPKTAQDEPKTAPGQPQDSPRRPQVSFVDLALIFNRLWVVYPSPRPLPRGRESFGLLP